MPEQKNSAESHRRAEPPGDRELAAAHSYLALPVWRDACTGSSTNTLEKRHGPRKWWSVLVATCAGGASDLDRHIERHLEMEAREVPGDE